MTTMFTEFSPLEWHGDSLRILDQRKLPAEEVWIETPDYREVVRSIQNMAVRGAPAFGIAGDYGLALAAMELGVARPPYRRGLATMLEGAGV